MTAVPEVWRQPFPEEEIPFILAALLRCMASVSKLDPCEHENRITTRLWKKLLRDGELNARPTHLDPEVWELNEEDEDGKIGRLDLRFLFSTAAIKPWPCFAIEAKRLHVTFPKAGWKSLVSEYVTSDTAKAVENEQGMMCFVSGRYSRGLRAGAMLGYVFDGNIKAARDSIGAAIQMKAKKLRLASPGWIRKSVVLANSGISESHHDLECETDIADLFGERFMIYHVLMPV
jgi:hypothetical protein